MSFWLDCLIAYALFGAVCAAHLVRYHQPRDYQGNPDPLEASTVLFYGILWPVYIAIVLADP